MAYTNTDDRLIKWRQFADMHKSVLQIYHVTSKKILNLRSSHSHIDDTDSLGPLERESGPHGTRTRMHQPVRR